MYLHLTRSAFQSLVEKSVKQGPTVVTKGTGGVGLSEKAMGRQGLTIHFVRARAGKADKFMAPLVYHKTTNSTLISLFANHSPDEIFAMSTVCRLAQEAGLELVVPYFMYLPTLDGPLPGKDLLGDVILGHPSIKISK